MIKMDQKDKKGLCFICEDKLVGNGIQLKSRRTYIGNELLTQKIDDLIGEHFVVTVNNEDRLCQDCVALLNDIDKLEIELKLVKNALLSGIKNKYGLSVDADDKIQPIMVEDGVLKADRSKASNPSELEQVKEHQKVPTPPKVLMPRQVPWPQQILRPQLPQQNILRPQLAPRLAQQGLRSQPLGRRIRVMLPQNVTEEKQVHMLQSKRQLFNQNDMPTYSNKKVAVEHNIQSTSGIFPVSQPKQVFKCKICVKYFIKQEVCLHHIQEYHDKPASIIMDEDLQSKQQWPAARLTRSATLPRKSRTVPAGPSSLACNSTVDGCGGCHSDKTPATAKKAYPSSGSSGYNSLPRMNGGRKSSSSVKNSPSSELSYKIAAAKAEDAKPDTPTGRGSNFDSSYSCDEISVNDLSITLTVPATPSSKPKTAADLRREYFRGLNKYGQAATSGSCGTGGGGVRGKDHHHNQQQQQHQQQQLKYFNRSANGGRDKQAIAASLHKYLDNACKIK